MRRAKAVVVYCSGFGCEASHVVARKLRERGIAAGILDEGLPAWEDAGSAGGQGGQALSAFLRSPRLQLVLRLLLGAYFVYASLDKIADPAAFAKVVYQWQVLGPVLSNLLAVTLPWVEILAGGLLIFGVWRKEAALVIALLLVVFLLAAGSVLARGIDIENCGCTSLAKSEQAAPWPPAWTQGRRLVPDHARPRHARCGAAAGRGRAGRGPPGAARARDARARGCATGTPETPKGYSAVHSPSKSSSASPVCLRLPPSGHSISSVPPSQIARARRSVRPVMIEATTALAEPVPDACV